MTGRAVAKLAVATVVVDALIWTWWKLDPGAPAGPTLPIVLSVLLVANIVVTARSHRFKRWLVALLQRFVLNPPIRLLLRIGVPLGYALIETTGRVSGRPRRNPVGNGREDGTFWIVAEHGYQAGYVRNIRHDPRVRVRMRDGWRFAWFTGTAHVLPDDDPYARQRALSRWHPLRALNAMVVRVMGTELLTIRIDLDPAPRAAGEVGRRETGGHGASGRFGVEEEGQPYRKAVAADQLTDVQAEELPLDIEEQREQHRRAGEAQLRQGLRLARHISGGPSVSG